MMRKLEQKNSKNIMKEKKQFRQLSDEELEKVNGGILPFVGVGGVSCYSLTLCAAQGKQLDTKTCKCY